MSTVISIPKMAIRAFLGLLLACCFISGITGDVPDGVVYTDLHQNALLGSRAVLKCKFYRTPLAVYWKKGDNPNTAPNLIFWVEEEPDSGSCVKDKACEMGYDYSLIIKNVSIADQGRYICRVSNYKGILLHNFTDVKVLAPPEEPYPIINDCKENKGQNCILLATGPVNITCTVLKYFPNVDLFFLHGIKKYSTADTLEWTNTDGTKSKSIFTTAPPSEIPYGCVAFNIPGSQEQRTVTVRVTGQSDVATTPSSRIPLPDGPIERNRYFVIKIVVPIITAFCVVTGIILFFTIHRRRQRRRETDKYDDKHEEAVPMVPRKKKNVPAHLLSPIEQTAVKKIVQKLTGRHCKRLMAAAKISNDNLERIIAENNEFLFDTKAMITDWLRKLECSTDYEKRCRFDNAVIKIGRYDLLDCFGTMSRRPLVVPSEEQQNLFDRDTIYDDDIPQLVKLIKCLPPEKIAQFNEKTGFSADRDDRMLEKDLRGRRDNILTRSTSHDALSEEFRSLRHELTKHTENFDSTVTDKEIEDVASQVTAADKQQELPGCLGIEAGAPKNISFADHLKKWLKTEANSRKGIQDLLRHIGLGDSTVTDEEIEDVASQVTAADKQQELPGCLGIEAGAPKNISFADQLKKLLKTEANNRKGIQDMLRHIGFGECIVSKSTKNFVYHVELSSIALNLLMEDVRPVIQVLAIDRSTVSSYIQPVTNENKGTKRLVLELLRSRGSSERSRDDFSKALQCIGFVDVSRSVYFDYEPSLSELIYILDCVGKGWMDRFLEHLDLSPDDIEECRESEAQIDKLKVMRVWKRQIRPVPYHYRLEIAKALRDVELNGIAKGVLSGEYRRKGLNADVLQGIYSRMGDEGLTRLCSSLKLGSESTSRSLEASTALVTKWVNEWMNEFNPNDTSVTSGHMHHVHRKRMNDELYANGFCELAEEISAVENCQQSAQ